MVLVHCWVFSDVTVFQDAAMSIQDCKGMLSLLCTMMLCLMKSLTEKGNQYN